MTTSGLLVPADDLAVTEPAMANDPNQRPQRPELALRNALAELLIEALDTGHGGAMVARDAIGLLAAYGRLATEDEPAVATEDLAGLGSALAGGLERVRAAGLLASPAPGNAIALDPAFVPFLAAIRSRVARYQDVLGAPAHGPPPGTVFARGALLFNAGLFFEVHEVLEASWRQAEGDLKTLLQGLVQIAVAYHHYDNGNDRGAMSLLHEGIRKVADTAHEAPSTLDLARFLVEVERWRLWLETRSSSGAVPPPLPQL